MTYPQVYTHVLILNSTGKAIRCNSWIKLAEYQLKNGIRAITSIIKVSDYVHKEKQDG